MRSIVRGRRRSDLLVRSCRRYPRHVMIRGFGGPRRSLLARRLPGWLQRRGVSVQVALTTLLLLASLLFSLGLVTDDKWMPPSSMILLALLAGYLLRFA